MTTFTIHVVGRPAPEGSHETGQHGHVMHSSAYLAAWRRAVQIAALRVMGEQLHELPAFGKGVPVYVHSMCIIVGDDQCRALGTAEPVGAPDLDKLLRATVDGLGDGKVFENDSQIVKFYDVEKRRALSDEEPGALIIISDEPWESGNVQKYQIILSQVDEDGVTEIVLNVTGGQATLAAVLPALGIIIDVPVSIGAQAPAGAAPQATEAPETEEAKTKRTRRTKAEIEAAKAAETQPAPAPVEASAVPVEPARVNPFAIS